MKMSLGTLISAVTSGSIIRLTRLDLPIRTAYAFNKVDKSIRSESENYDERRHVLLRKYGTQIEGTNNFSIHDVPSYNRDMEALNAIEVELPGESIKLSEILSAKDGRLTAEDITKLEPFINNDMP